MNRGLLLTRPLVESRRFASYLRRQNKNIRIVFGPLFEIQQIEISHPPLNGRTLIFTSKNAVESFNNADIEFVGKALCVGEATAMKARDYGMRTVSSGGGVNELIDLIREFVSPKEELVYYRGMQISYNLSLALKKLDYKVKEVICYQKCPQKYSVPLKKKILNGSIKGAVFFSKETVKLFSSNISSLPNGFLCFCMSQKISEKLAEIYSYKKIDIKVSEFPSTNAMGKLILAAFDYHD